MMEDWQQGEPTDSGDFVVNALVNGKKVRAAARFHKFVAAGSGYSYKTWFVNVDEDWYLVDGTEENLQVLSWRPYVPQ